MSEPTQLPTVRLLEPRALVAADRVASRVMDRSAMLLRRIDGGSTRFASRMFDSWFGPPVEERIPSARAQRVSPRTMEFARPWYELPSVWPKKGIVLGGQPRAEASPAGSPPRARGPIEDLRALELVSSYASPPEDLAGDVRAFGPAAVSGAPIVLAARLADRLVRVEQMLRTTSLDGPVSPSRAAIARPTLELLTAAADPSVPTVRSTSFAVPQTLVPAERVSMRVQAPSAAAAIELRPALQHALPTAWPRIQHFIERLAGPAVLERAGTLTPREQDLHTVTAAGTGDGRERVRSVAPFTRELLAMPSPALSPALSPARSLAVPPGVAAARPAVSRQAATSLGEIAQAEHQRPLGMPGRVAQHAELIATVAAQRVDRQLGLAPAEAPRSVRRSADAFTVLSLDAPAVEASAVAPGTPARGTRPQRSAPLSIASLLAFGDAQLGARFLGATRALPVLSPTPVYVADAPEPRPRAATPSRRGEVTRPLESQRPAEAGRSAEFGRTFEVARPTESTKDAWPAIGLATALGAGVALEPVRAFSMGQVGVRSEQMAGEVGLHAASLATEFMFDADAEAAASGAAAEPAIARAAQRGWLSTSEWALLSLFPTPATAQQIARQIVARASASPSLAYVAPTASTAPPSAGEPASRAGGARAPSAMPMTALRAGDFGVRAAGASSAAESFAGELGARALATPPRAVAGAPLVMLLPDGRRPRGGRLAPHTTGLRLAGAEAPQLQLLAGVEAAERRAEAPVGVPLWGQLPHLDAPVQSGPRGQLASVRALGGPALPREVSGPRSVALELLAPYVEPAAAAAPSSSSSSASFSSSTPPAVSARSSDDATRSLVTALQSSSSQPGSDRLSMADMTLISIVAATEQVAAKKTGGDGQFGGTTPPTNTSPKHGRGHGRRRKDRNFEEDVERYVNALLQELNQYYSDSGQGQE